MLKLLSVVLVLGLLGAAPVSGQTPVSATLRAMEDQVIGQTVTEKAKARIAQEKEEARVSEARRLLKEKAEKEARIVKIEKRLVELDKGAEPESEAEHYMLQDLCTYIDRYNNCR